MREAERGTPAPTLIGGEWRHQSEGELFGAADPSTGDSLGRYPISTWDAVDEALAAGVEAYSILRDTEPKIVAGFLRRYADRIEERADEIVAVAHAETALPKTPRLADVELPRTTDQLRQAADAAADRSWTSPAISPRAKIASMLAPIPGVVCVFGPNNFPLAFNSVAGGDFAAAIATGHPVLAKANPGHPGTTRLLTEEAYAAAHETHMPAATVQLLYRTSHVDGERMVADHRLAATAYTGSRHGGLALKSAADTAGRPIYLEMSSVNPVVILPGAARQRPDEIATSLIDSLLLGCGQFCTNPGLTFVVSDEAGRAILDRMADQVLEAPGSTLLGEGVLDGLEEAQRRWSAAGAEVLATGTSEGPGWSRPNTLMTVDEQSFRASAASLQEEAFGNMGLIVQVESVERLSRLLEPLEGNLTGTIYAADDGSDDQAYAVVAPILREKVGRLLNDKPPTGVAVVGGMNHGGPYPATGHPGFTAVGIPASLTRFGMLQSFDNVANHRLPPELQAENPLGIQRCIDSEWTRESFSWGEEDTS